jgi:hypothetical protein
MARVIVVRVSHGSEGTSSTLDATVYLRLRDDSTKDDRAVS